MAEKKSFIIRHENIEQFEMLTSEQQGKLLMAMCYYSRDRVETEFDDPMMRMLFSVMRGQISRDTEKYEDLCQKRSESGKKGGAPKGNRNASKTSKTNNSLLEQPKTSKTSKTSIPNPNPNPNPNSNPVPVCEPVCDPESACADGTPPHTPHTAEELTVDWVLDFAKSRGFMWTPEEAERFIAYNRDRGRHDGWDYAADRWEQGRIKRASSGSRSAEPSAVDTSKANKYLQFVNRFKEDDHDAV